MNISTNIKSIQDIMRKDTGIDGDAQRISQMGWMLFSKSMTTASSSANYSTKIINPRPGPPQVAQLGFGR